MLNRDLWMIWPTGYYGSYIHWLISKSEVDLSEKTLDSPFFSNGSSHAHIKNPPHHTIEFALQCMLRNRYPKGTIYPLGVKSNVTFNSANNNWMKSFDNTVFWILRIDHEPVILNIHNDENLYQTKLAAVNVYNKENWIVDEFNNNNNYNPFVDKNTLNARNYVTKNWKSLYPYQNKKVTVDMIKNFRDSYNIGNKIRHFHEGHEYNLEDNWIYATGKHIYNISLTDILNKDFIKNILSTIMADANIGNFDWDKTNDVHAEFISRQQPYIQIANDLYTQARNLVYHKNLDDNILYSGLAIDTLLELHGHLPNNWQELSLQQIVKSYDK